MKTKKRILVAPLDWGIGHATRCIPIIKELINQNYEVIIVRNYTKDVVNDFFNGKEILLEQRSRNTLQLVVIDI